MKKLLAMMLATATVMSVGVTAFAEDTTTSNETTDSSAVEEILPETTPEAPSSSDSNSTPSSSEESKPEVPAVDPSAFVFGTDADNDATLGHTILEPGVEYKFPVSLTIGDKTEAMTSDMIKDYKFTYSKLSSNGVQTFKMEEYKGTYYLYVEVKQSTPTKPIDVKYNVKLVRKSNNMSVFSQEVKFQYGYDETNGDYVNGLEKGDIIEIDNSRPVVTASQFDKIAKINDYKNVTLSGSFWSFNVNVTDESTKNMVSNNAGIKEILSKLPDQEFKFYNFAGKPTFNSTGRVALDVSDIIDEYDNLYTYRYVGGKLYKMNATLNSDENTLEFRTNKLDNFIVTNKAIKDGFIISTDVAGDSTDDSNDAENDTDSDKDVPSTGASDMLGGAMAAAAALAAAGIVISKKRG